MGGRGAVAKHLQICDIDRGGRLDSAFSITRGRLGPVKWTAWSPSRALAGALGAKGCGNEECVGERGPHKERRAQSFLSPWKHEGNDRAGQLFLEVQQKTRVKTEPTKSQRTSWFLKRAACYAPPPPQHPRT